MSGKWKDRRTAAERGYGRSWGLMRSYVMARDAGLCQPCLRHSTLMRAREVDHIIPKSKGGTEDPENLQAICIDCHKEKTALEANGGKLREATGADGWPISRGRGGSDR